MGLSAAGIKRFAKSVWKSFKSEFGVLEMNLNAAKGEVDEEIRLASEQKLHDIHVLQLIEHEENRLHRMQQLTEVKESRAFRETHVRALAEAKDLRIQKVVKEEGDWINL